MQCRSTLQEKFWLIQRSIAHQQQLSRRAVYPVAKVTQTRFRGTSLLKIPAGYWTRQRSCSLRQARSHGDHASSERVLQPVSDAMSAVRLLNSPDLLASDDVLLTLVLSAHCGWVPSRKSVPTRAVLIHFDISVQKRSFCVYCARHMPVFPLCMPGAAAE